MNDNTSDTTEDAAPSTSAIGVINTDTTISNTYSIGITNTNTATTTATSSSRSTCSSSSSVTAGCLLSLSNDARLEFVTSYTLTSLRLKHDKWHKMMATQEYQVKIPYKYN